MKYQITKQQVEALSRGDVITCGYMSFKASGRVQDICKAILNKNMPDFFDTIIDRGAIVSSIYVSPRGIRKKRKIRR
jgi:hypothetical protein